MTNHTHARSNSRACFSAFLGLSVSVVLLLFSFSARAQWIKKITTGDDEYFLSVKYVNDTHYGEGAIAVGRVFDGNFSRGWIARFDNDGNLWWSNTLSPFPNTQFTEVFLTETNSVVDGYLISGQLGVKSYLVEIDLWGGIQNQCTFGDFKLNSVSRTQDGNIVATGQGSNDSPLLIKADMTPDEDCDVLWSRELPSGDSENSGSKVIQTSTGDIIVVGKVDIDPHPHDETDGFIAKFSNDGVFHWAKQIRNDTAQPYNESVELFDVKEVFDEYGDPDGYVTVGKHRQSTSIASAYPFSYLLVSRLDNVGYVRWTKFYRYPQALWMDPHETNATGYSVNQVGLNEFLIMGEKDYW